MQRVIQKALPQVDKRIDWRVDRKLEERVLPELPRQSEVLSELAEDMAKALFTMGEIRRWMIDDLEAANETTVLVGESLARLQASMERLGDEVAAIGQRLAAVEAALASPSTTQPA
jgi:predicted trehalose synthase